MKKYVKTYEMFGFSKKEKDEAAKKLQAANDEIKKHQEEIEKERATKLQEGSANIVKRYSEAVEEYLHDLDLSQFEREWYIDELSCESHELQFSANKQTIIKSIVVYITLDNMIITSTIDPNVTLPVKSIKLEIPLLLTLSLGKKFQTMGKTLSNETTTSIEITNSSPIKSVAVCSKMINSKGDVSDDEISISLTKTPAMRPYGGPGASQRIAPKVITQLIVGTTNSELDLLNFNNSKPSQIEMRLGTLRNFIHGKIEAKYKKAVEYLDNKIKEFREIERLAKFNAIDESEIRDILSDIFDISTEHNITKEKDHYTVYAKISNYPTSKAVAPTFVKLHKLNKQIFNYLIEIRDRLEDLEMEMSVELGPTIKMIIHMSQEEEFHIYDEI